MSKNLLVVGEGVIILALIGVLVFRNFSLGFGNAGILNSVSKEEIGGKTIDFIKNNLARPNTEIELKDTEESHGIYKINFNIMGQDETAYVTKDAKYLFFQPIDMQPPKPQELPQAEKPSVDLFVMSFCPFGNQTEELMMPVAKLLGNKADIELHYILYSNYSSGYPDYCIDKENKYCSMHGIQEVHQDIRELCVAKYQKDKFWDFVQEINKQATSENVDQKWESVAQGLGIDVQQIKTCQEQEGQNLLAKEVELTRDQYPVQDPSKHKGKEKEEISASPTLTINGMIYDGQRGSNEYKEAICSAFSKAPAECSQNLNNPGSESGASSGSCK